MLPDDERAEIEQAREELSTERLARRRRGPKKKPNRKAVLIAHTMWGVLALLILTLGVMIGITYMRENDTTAATGTANANANGDGELADEIAKEKARAAKTRREMKEKEEAAARAEAAREAAAKKAAAKKKEEQRQAAARKQQQETARLEAERKREAAQRAEAARVAEVKRKQEAARLEEERKEAARKEAERKEAARLQAEREAAARAEAERKARAIPPVVREIHDLIDAARRACAASSASRSRKPVTEALDKTLATALRLISKVDKKDTKTRTELRMFVHNGQAQCHEVLAEFAKHRRPQEVANIRARVRGVAILTYEKTLKLEGAATYASGVPAKAWALQRIAALSVLVADHHKGIKASYKKMGRATYPRANLIPRYTIKANDAKAALATDYPDVNILGATDPGKAADLAPMPATGPAAAPKKTRDLYSQRFDGRAQMRKTRLSLALSIKNALVWLEAHQDGTGRWDCDGFMRHDKGTKCDGAGNPVHDIGVTSLAVLAFLADGSTTQKGPFQNAVKRGTDWLVSQQGANGLVGNGAQADFIYDHAIAALALCEAFGLSKDEALRAPAQKAIDYLELHRNPKACWRYQPRDNDNDASVTSWCLLALGTAREFGLNVAPGVIPIGQRYLDQMTTPATGRCGYRRRGQKSSRHPGDHGTRYPIDRGEAVTAEALFTRLFLGEQPAATPALRAAADTLLTKPPVWDRTGSQDHYYWFFGTSALYQMGGKYWTQWSKPFQREVTAHQRTDGPFKGSWDPTGAWGEDGGRVYSTAVLVMALQAPYRYARVVK